MSNSFTLVNNSSNLSNPDTNGTYTYNFNGGGFKVEDDMYVMLSSAQVPYSIFNITPSYNNNKFTFFFPSGSTATTYSTNNTTIHGGALFVAGR